MTKMEKRASKAMESLLNIMERGGKVGIACECTSSGNYYIEHMGETVCRTSGSGFNKEANALAMFLCNLFPVDDKRHFELYHHLDSGRKNLESFGFKLEFVSGLRNGTNVYQLSKV